MNGFQILDPLDIEVRPGVRVRDLNTLDECNSAVLVLETERMKIMGQIARSEELPGSRPNGWRTKAQAARTWKKKAIAAIRVRADLLARAEGGPRDKRQAILRTIKEAIGADEFSRLVALARMQNPDLDWSQP